MLNPATQPRPKWNAFTEFLRDNPGVMVRLRNDMYVKPTFKVAEDETCSDAFQYVTANAFMIWRTDGTSITSQDFDMMEIENA